MKFMRVRVAAAILLIVSGAFLLVGEAFFQWLGIPWRAGALAFVAVLGVVVSLLASTNEWKKLREELGKERRGGAQTSDAEDR